MRLTLSGRGFGELLAASAVVVAVGPAITAGEPVRRFWIAIAAALILVSAFDAELFTAGARRLSALLQRASGVKISLVTGLAFVLFAVVIVPVGLVFRVFGRDRVGRRLHRDAASYWEGPARADVGTLRDPF